MPETKHEKFTRLRDNRVPKIIHALSLLENLSGSAYEWSEAEAREMIEALDAAVDGVADAFNLSTERMRAFGLSKPSLIEDEVPVEKTSSVPAAETSCPQEHEAAVSIEESEGDEQPPEVPSQEPVSIQHTIPPGFIAEGGASARNEVAWAYDAVQRKDLKLAANRLKRVLDAWKKMG